MYKLKNPIKNLTMSMEITDDQYSDLSWWTKWKYEYFVKSFTKTTPVSNSRPYSKAYQTPQTTVVNNTTIIEEDNNYDPTSAIVTGMVLENLLDSTNQNSIDYSDQQAPQNTEPFGGFGGGDFGGGGSSDTWDAPDTPTQDTSPSNDYSSSSDNNSYDSSSSSDSSSYDSSSSDSGSYDSGSSGGGDY